MNIRKGLSTVHLASTIWFMLCTGYVFIIALQQLGFNWLVIFSLSGHWALLVFLLVCLYLFSIFRGAGESSLIHKEHPLTSTTYYMTFYVSTPLMGAIAGILGMLGEKRIDSLLGGIALGTIGATFLTWIVVDSIAGSIELLTPQVRKYRAQRFAQAKLLKQQEQTRREQLLAQVMEQEKKNNQLWQEALTPHANRLANLLNCSDTAFSSAEQEAIKLGIDAWRMGGLSCMKHLHNLAVEIFKQQYNDRQFVDYISAWWDGIGRWRNTSLVSN